ncbi:MAG: transcriptional repressor NrdR [Chloroflexi bacterium]|nr:transcriptional repressor NrdR [Chloroflexota bacterium]
MLCPHCGHNDSRVIDSRDAADGIRRRRECLQCGQRFTTYERVQTNALLVVKRDGRREAFQRDKLFNSVRLACAKRPLPIGALDRLVNDMERQLLRSGRAEVASSTIGELVMERLKALDRVAYIRYASVYRSFADLETFKAELERELAAREAVGAAPQSQPPLFPLEEPPPLVVPERRRRGRPRKGERG